MSFYKWTCLEIRPQMSLPLTSHGTHGNIYFANNASMYMILSLFLYTVDSLLWLI